MISRGLELLVYMYDTMKEKILIIPDVHGRSFWKKAVETGDYEKVVFLGDYADPYEWVTIPLAAWCGLTPKRWWLAILYPTLIR